MTLRRSTFALGLLASCMMAPGIAAAQQVSGLYIAGGLGASWKESVSSGNNNTDWNVGWTGVASVGWGFGNGIRLEGEVSYRENEFDTFTRNNQLSNSVGGVNRQVGLMANALYDIPTGWSVSGVTINPYIGGGIGAGWVQGSGIRAGFPGGGSFTIDNGSGWNFAYQAIGGFAFGLGQFVPGLSLTAEYRYYATLDVDYSGSNRSNAASASSRVSGSASNQNQSVLVGFRYAFNTPRPAPVAAPAPAPAPARTFLVFFDWDRADLTDRARQIIAEAATNARTVRSTRIEVSGHADRTGSAAYNQRLSVRRAEAVAAELVRRGIPRNEMTIQGFGFDRPLVPTAMGVREPQNRRVEIVLR
ncbi:OmpA family protein [Roseococcus sp. SDR]|uniref:OmpA family protein n=1 Tax=Roseococcus sp. SDR TaxID=2835532 RepID=UPI001BCD744C|nr:OmpA family protein [Roseococcus sp. SDR]MBS7789064.1 OmpA family protein [Roseococcus sp. SDR]MBV1844378.1 OmpA family protein [Roseococcus sp. SDR]